MAKDSLQQTWVKSLSSIVSTIDSDSKGNVWVGDMSGTLTKFSGEGVASAPVHLDNPISSVSVDKGTDDVYVGDFANNLYKYNSNGTLKWGKNLGKGSQADFPIVSTINSTNPDKNGNFDLTATYYSKKQINEKLQPLGNTKSLNGILPDEAGNIVLDLSKYFAFKGVLNADQDLDKCDNTGWYIEHNTDGQSSIFIVYANDKDIVQLVYGYDGSMQVRSSTGSTFTDWYVLTNNIREINGLKPDKNGSIKLDLTGNIKSVNGLKPDKDGNIQLGVGSKNTIKSINTIHKPDETGNVTVPTFAPNLLQGSTNKKITIPVDSNDTIINLWEDNDISTSVGKTSAGIGTFVADGNQGEALVSDTPIVGGESYSYRLIAMTLADTLGVPELSYYTAWRKPRISVYLTFKDKDSNVIGVSKQVLTQELDQSDTLSMVTFLDSFTAPANATTFSIWYNGLEQTADNLVKEAYGQDSNDQEQLTDLKTFALAQALKPADRLAVKIQVRVNNYKSGSYFMLKTKSNTNSSSFVNDNSKLDSKDTLIKAAIDNDDSNLIYADGFYDQEFVVSANDLIGFDKSKVTVVTDIVGTFTYTVKVALWGANSSKPDMEFISAPSINDKTGAKIYGKECYNKLEFFDGSVFLDKTVNVFDLGSYNLDNDFIALDDTVGKYSASAHVDMGNSNGYSILVLEKVDVDGKVISKAESSAIPFISKDESGTETKDVTGTLEAGGINNDEPKLTDTIKLFLYIYGQTDIVTVSQQKVAQWKDNDQTPPDLTWFPSVQDIAGSVQSVNDLKPDKNGNIDLTDNLLTMLSSLPNMSQGNTKKDFVNVTVNPDSIIETGTYRLSSCTVTANYGSTGTDTFKGNQWGWLINLNYENDPNSNAIYQLLILNEVVYYRVISVMAKHYPAFRTFVYDTDLVALTNTIHKELVNLDMFNANYGNNIYNTTIDLDTYSTVGLSKFLNCKLVTKGKAPLLDSNKGFYGWILNIPKWQNAQELEQFVYICESNYTFTRERPSSGSNVDFIRVANSNDLTNVNTMVQPKIISGSLNFDKFINSGIYFYNASLNTNSSDVSFVDAPKDYDGTDSYVNPYNDFYVVIYGANGDSFTNNSDHQVSFKKIQLVFEPFTTKIWSRILYLTYYPYSSVNTYEPAITYSNWSILGDKLYKGLNTLQNSFSALKDEVDGIAMRATDIDDAAYKSTTQKDLLVFW